MNISKDKKYRTVGGKEVRIYAVDGTEHHHIHGAIKLNRGWAAETWTSAGRVWAGESDDYDLVEVKPKIKRLMTIPELWAKWPDIEVDGEGNWRHLDWGVSLVPNMLRFLGRHTGSLGTKWNYDDNWFIEVDAD